jgi:hypothetical protein
MTRFPYEAHAAGPLRFEHADAWSRELSSIGGVQVTARTRPAPELVRAG